MAANRARAPDGAEQDASLLGRYFLRYTDEFYLLFRLVFAFIVSLHGAQKAFLLWGFPATHPLGARTSSRTRRGILAPPLAPTAARCLFYGSPSPASSVSWAAASTVWNV